MSKHRKHNKHQKQRDSSDESQDDEYEENDGFVIDENEEEDEPLDQNNDDDDDDYNESLSEEDHELINENKQNKKGRLKRVDDEQEESSQVDNQEQESSPHIQEQEEDIDQNDLINRLFDPTQRDQEFLNQADEDIIKQNIPESIQLVYMKNNNRSMLNIPRPEADKQHISLVAEALIKEFEFQPQSAVEIMSGVKLILECYRKECLDVMYIWTYKRYLITEKLQLVHYWRIRDLDYEYEAFKLLKDSIEKEISSLPEGQHTHLFKQYLNLITSMEQLQNVKDYIDYVKMKLRCRERLEGQMEVESEEPRVQNKMKRNESRMMEMMRAGIEEIMLGYVYTADEYFQVLQSNKVPFSVNRKLFKTIEELNQAGVKQHFSITKDPASFVKTMQKYLAMELYHHPFIREFVQKLYYDSVLVSTEPTPQGNQSITVTSYLFPAKRIKQRPIRYLEEQTWLMVLKAEEQGYIKVTFQVSKEFDPKQKLQRDDIQAKLAEKFTNISMEKEDENVQKQRDVLLRWVLQEYWYPILEKQTRQKLKQAAIKQVLGFCQRQFRSLINAMPHTSPDTEVRVMAMVFGAEGATSRQLQNYTLDSTIQKKHIGMAIVDAKGELLRLHIFNYLTADKRRDDLQEAIRKEKAQLERFIDEYKPGLVVISANSPDSLKLRADIRSQYSDSSKLWVTMAESHISKIYSLSEQSKAQLPEYPAILKEAVSLARHKLNPLAEILNLWNDKHDQNGCLHINLHPLQGMIPQSVLSDSLAQVATEIVNSAGIDIVDAALHKHLQEQVRFLNGLGPRQSRHLLMMFKGLLSRACFGNNFENEKVILNKLNEEQRKDHINITRKDIMVSQILGKTIYKNFEGFIKLTNGIHPLDSTRMLGKMYSDATHICKCALDIQGQKEDKQYTAIRQLMEKPSKMDDLELDEWAKQKEQRENLEHFKKVVDFMRQELKQPFKHYYDETEEMSASQIFYAVTQESPHTFKKGSIVQGVVVKIQKDQSMHALVKLSDNGLMGTLNQSDCESLDKMDGTIIKAFVKRILALEKEKQKSAMTQGQNQNQNQNLLKVELTMKFPYTKDYVFSMLINPMMSEQVRSVTLGNARQEQYNEKIKETFDIQKALDQDCPEIKVLNTNRLHQRLILRNINHPKFKQVLLKGALEYIESQPVGEYLIRPNVQKQDFFTITWKFFEGVIVHLYVQEQQKQGSYKPSLILKDGVYDSFDDIFERYIAPCNARMESAANYKKFQTGSLEAIEKSLRDQKEQNEDIIPYSYCVTDKAPQYIVLMYMKDRSKVEREFIKVKPDGLIFHQHPHDSLKDVTNWFKSNFRTPEYKSFLKRAKPPFVENDRLGQINQQWEVDVKKEKVKDEKTKIEDSTNYNMTCSKCGKRGHNANDCRHDHRYTRDNRDYKRDSRDYRDNRDRDRDRDRDNRDNRGCFNCGATDHIKKNCQAATRRRDRSNSREREKYPPRNRQIQPKMEESIDF